MNESPTNDGDGPRSAERENVPAVLEQYSRSRTNGSDEASR